MDGIRPWADLPHDILELIINKLRFFNHIRVLRFPDLIRALAVCKGWRDCEDYVSYLDILPWAVNPENVICSESSGRYKYTVICQLCDPYSHNVFKVVNSIEPDKKLGTQSYGLASKNGWLLQRVKDYNLTSTALTLYHPFANHKILLPKFEDSRRVKVAMKADPSSPECEIFVISNSYYGVLINTFCLSRDYEGQSKIVEKGESIIVQMTEHDFIGLQSVLYMKGKIYCVSNKGALYSYGLKDKSWKLLTKKLPEPYKLSCGWLLEINENIILVCSVFHAGEIEWRIFVFDWSKMSWVVETSLKSCAIYISHDIAFSICLTDRYGKKLEGCRVFDQERVFVPDSDMGLKCIQSSSDEYGWIKPASFMFVHPPSRV